MSAALVRKALDETSVGSEGKLGQLSRTVGSKFCSNCNYKYCCTYIILYSSTKDAIFKNHV